MKNKLQEIKAMGLDGFPVIVAKTQYSLSSNEKLLGTPKKFYIVIKILFKDQKMEEKIVQEKKEEKPKKEKTKKLKQEPKEVQDAENQTEEVDEEV